MSIYISDTCSVTREETMAVTMNFSVPESPATKQQSLAPEIDKN